MALVISETTNVSADTPAIIISDYEIRPSVLMPGDTGILTATLTNTAHTTNIKESTVAYVGNSFTETKTTDINEKKDNIHLEGNGIIVVTDDFDHLGGIGPGQSIQLSFLIRAPNRSGIFFPEIWIDTLGGTSTRHPIPVNVNTHIALLKKPELILEKNMPASIIPGEDFNASLILANDGKRQADDITLKINVTGSGIYLNTPANYHFYHLNTGEKEELKLSGSTDKNIPPGIRVFTITIDYMNPDGTPAKLEESVGLHIQGKAKLGISSITTDPVRIYENDPFTLIVRIENTGTGDADSVQVFHDLPLTGSKEAFVGKIEPDDDASAVFYLKADGNGTIKDQVRIWWTADYGGYTLTNNIELTVGKKGESGLFLVLLLLLIGGVGWLWHIRRSGD